MPRSNTLNVNPRFRCRRTTSGWRVNDFTSLRDLSLTPIIDNVKAGTFSTSLSMYSNYKINVCVCVCVCVFVCLFVCFYLCVVVVVFCCCLFGFVLFVFLFFLCVFFLFCFFWGGWWGCWGVRVSFFVCF